MKYLPAKRIAAALTLACLAGYGGLSAACAAGRNSWTGTSYRHYNYGFRVIVMPAQDAPWG